MPCLDLPHQLGEEARVEGVGEARQELAGNANVNPRCMHTYNMYMKGIIYAVLAGEYCCSKSGFRC